MGRRSPHAFRIRLNADVAFAELAGDFDTEVFRGDSQFFFAVATFGVERLGLDTRAGQVDFELAAAVFAGNPDACVLAVDAKLFRAVRADQEISCNFHVDHVADLL